MLPPLHIELAKKIAAYHRLNQEPQHSDCIIALGSNDPRVAERAVELYQLGLAPYLVFSGGVGALTEGLYKTSEAEYFAEIALARGVPEKDLILETQSKNTGENVRFVRELLLTRKLNPASAIAVQKPYMERRTLATFGKFWPELKITVTSPQITFDDYALPSLSLERVIAIMVGDLQRIHEYPKLGYQIFQEVPKDVQNAFDKLVEFGYTEHLIRV